MISDPVTLCFYYIYKLLPIFLFILIKTKCPNSWLFLLRTTKHTEDKGWCIFENKDTPDQICKSSTLPEI